jgi:hypothetical protein
MLRRWHMKVWRQDQESLRTDIAHHPVIKKA